jgi:hypothetical protein
LEEDEEGSGVAAGAVIVGVASISLVVGQGRGGVAVEEEGVTAAVTQRHNGRDATSQWM